MEVVKLGRMSAGDIAAKLYRGDALEVLFYNRRVGVIVPMPHQAMSLELEGLAEIIIDVASAGGIVLSQQNIVKLAQMILGNGVKVE